MLKLMVRQEQFGNVFQPPSGGCVLKHDLEYAWGVDLSAAFRRLCVETRCQLFGCQLSDQPPSGGCVLKLFVSQI